VKRTERLLLRSALVQRICTREPHLSEGDIALVVNVLLEGIALRLAEGGRVEIRGFGTFATRVRRGRVGRNPKTGQRVQVPERRVPRFSASPYLLRCNKEWLGHAVGGAERSGRHGTESNVGDDAVATEANPSGHLPASMVRAGQRY
jgi:integration host factor subunit beta